LLGWRGLGRRAGLVVAAAAALAAAWPGGTAFGQSVTFAKLWHGYPVGNPYPDPAGRFGDNQCAIRLSVALRQAGVDMRWFAGMAVVEVGGKPVAIRADELAAWLQLRRPAGVGAAEVITGEDWRRRISGRTGIVYFHEYMPAGGGGGLTASHIDLWNGWRLSLGSWGNDWEVACGLVGVMPEGVGACYDKGRAREILFWPVR
jgi:hypothetical protein